MWKNEIIIWEQTKHDWNDFGNRIEVNFDDDPMYAKVLAIWKEQTLGEFIKMIGTFFVNSNRFMEDQNITSGLILALTIINLLPINLKLVWDDEHAEQFLRLLHEDDDTGDQYFIKDDLLSVGDIDFLIEYFISQNILEEIENRLIVKGKVLNRVHLRQNK